MRGNQMRMGERFVALVMLVFVWPTILLVALLIRATSDGPVLLTDRVICDDGSEAQSYRFRTTGQGTEAFRVIGRFLRHYRIDDWPALWSVVLGRIGLWVVLRDLF
jgi:lipopolysaccharide/colanic/teichoic acid biosynthesis glycosyltransferase